MHLSVSDRQFKSGQGGTLYCRHKGKYEPLSGEMSESCSFLRGGGALSNPGGLLTRQVEPEMGVAQRILGWE